MGRVGVGDMKKSVYDPDDDGLIAVGQIEMTSSKVAVGQGLGSSSVEEDKPTAGIWTYLETLSPSGVTSISSSVLTPHDLWMIILDVYAVKAPPAEEHLEIRFNDDAGTNYDSRFVNGTAIATDLGANQAAIGSLESYTTRKYPGIGQLFVKGKSGGDASDELPITGIFGAASIDAVQYDRIVNASWKCGVADITKMTFLCDEAMTGKIKIFYMDY